MKRFIVFAVLSLLPLALACGATHWPLRVPEGPDGSVEWIWQTEAGTTYYVPGRGYTWAVDVDRSVRVPGRQHVLAAIPTTTQPLTWVQPITDADHGLAAVGAGYVYEIHCILQTTASDASFPTLYVAGFDQSSASQPTNGATPIYGSVSGGLTTAGNDVTFADQTYPAVTFSSGLMLALSTTPDTFTAPTAGNQMRCDVKLKMP